MNAGGNFDRTRQRKELSTRGSSYSSFGPPPRGVLHRISPAMNQKSRGRRKIVGKPYVNDSFPQTGRSHVCVPSGTALYSNSARDPSHCWPCREDSMKKWLGLFGLLGAIAAAVMFWRRQQDDDEFLDEELD